MINVGRFVDLTGQTFNYLTVIAKSEEKIRNRPAWVCKCLRCGKTHITSTYLLKNGKVKSCGCLREDNWRVSQDKITAQAEQNHKHDLLGKRFDKLVVIKYLGNDKWECKCDCGNIVSRARSTLLYGTNLRSCMICGRVLPQLTRYPGMVINNLKLIKYDVGSKKWLCECLLCGNTKLINSGDLSKTVSCGCRNIYKDGSALEQEIRQFINKDCDIHRRDLLGNMQEIDIFYPDLSIGVEVNGSAFHATVSSTYVDKPKLYHQNKFLLAKERNIHLINIFDVDWENNSEKIKMYLNSLFNPSMKIYARKCLVKPIEKDLATVFCNQYHLQGSTRLSSINYGLYYKDELISVMCFGKLRMQKQKQDYYELHRYCVKDGISIIGGASKLLKAFEQDYSPKSILSYSDNDFFLGSVYEKLGFECKGQVTPRYYWCYGDKVLQREQCQLKKLKREYPELYIEASKVSNKEDFIMSHLGFCKVYRSGNTRWEKFKGE